MTSNLIPQGISSLPDYIESVFERYGDAPAYTALNQTLSFAEIEQKSRALANWFRHHGGLNPGDRIVIQLPNLLQNPIAVYAALRAGLVVVNTNPLYTPPEMEHQFNDSGAKAIVILADLLPNLNKIRANTGIKTVIATRATDLISSDASDIADGVVPFNQALEVGTGLEFLPRPAVDMEDVCMLQYTGGTTGVSKGAALCHRNILCNSVQVLERLGSQFEELEETAVCPLPLYHIYAFTVCMMTLFAKGAHIVLIPNPRDLDAFVGALKPHKITAFAGINTLFVGLCQHPEFKQLDFSGMKLTISGGTALTTAATDLWLSVTGCSITEGYGLSETSPVVTFNTPQKEQYGTVGTPLLETTIELLGDNDKPVAEGEEGEIAVHGPQVMLGYWQRPEETAKVMTDNGFFKTGDVGVRLDDGSIKIVDRLKDLVIVSGFNVYPNEVENVLTGHPSVLEAAVIGAADERTGERVCAYVTVNSEVDTEQLIAHCRESLTAYKVPKEIHIMEELPKSTVGKILRRELRK